MLPVLAKRFSFHRILLAIGFYFTLALPFKPAFANIYQWTDSQGRVHYGDKRAANTEAIVLGQRESAVTTDGLVFTFVPEADALLIKTRKSAQGKSSLLSSGYWSAHNRTLETRSLIRFEISSLLRELKLSPDKQLAGASLELFANIEDKLYGQGTTNRESPGHSTKTGDNAFYLKPVYNEWEEQEVTWESFYNPSHHTPAAIRQLPTVSVPGSDGVPDKTFLIDVSELVAGLVLAGQREFTLEISPQRRATMAQVTFYSREGPPANSPRLTVNLEPVATEKKPIGK